MTLADRPLRTSQNIINTEHTVILSLWSEKNWRNILNVMSSWHTLFSFSYLVKTISKQTNEQMLISIPTLWPAPTYTVLLYRWIRISFASSASMWWATAFLFTISIYSVSSSLIGLVSKQWRTQHNSRFLRILCLTKHISNTMLHNAKIKVSIKSVLD